MVQDSNGRWNSFKPNFCQADLVFSDGHMIRTTICSECFSKDPDFKKLMDSITSEDSEAASYERKIKIKEMGLPVSWSLSNAKQGDKLK